MKSHVSSGVSCLVTLKSRLGREAMMSRLGLEAMMSRLCLGRFGSGSSSVLSQKAQNLSQLFASCEVVIDISKLLKVTYFHSLYEACHCWDCSVTGYTSGWGVVATGDSVKKLIEMIVTQHKMKL